MDARVFLVGFENYKRMFYKNRLLYSIIALSFIISYGACTLFIHQENMDVVMSIEDFFIYFLNDYKAIGIFLSVVYILFIVNMFKDFEYNYMYFLRFNRKVDSYNSWIVSIILSSVTFLIIIFSMGIIISSTLFKFIGNQWSSGALSILNLNNTSINIINTTTPLTTMIISFILWFFALIILGMCFYIGNIVFRGIGGGLIFSIGYVIVNLIIMILPIKAYTLIPKINSLVLDSKIIQYNGRFSTIYYLIFLIFVAVILYIVGYFTFKKREIYKKHMRGV